MDGKLYEDDEMDKFPIECQYLEESKKRDKNPSVRKILVQVLITVNMKFNLYIYIWYFKAIFSCLVYNICQQ